MKTRESNADGNVVKLPRKGPGKNKRENPDEWKQEQQQEAPRSQRVEWLWRQVG